MLPIGWLLVVNSYVVMGGSLGWDEDGLEKYKVRRDKIKDVVEGEKQITPVCPPFLSGECSLSTFFRSNKFCCLLFIVVYTYIDISLDEDMCLE